MRVRRRGVSRFASDWAPLALLLVPYELMRDAAARIGLPRHDLGGLERTLLGGHEPSVVIQAAFYQPGSVGWQDVLGTSVYFHFTGWFEAMGYRVTAPDLPGHGDLDRAGLRKIPLSTYVSAVASAGVLLRRPMILVGHSMGGFIVQKYLETAEADLAVLLASTPPSGAFGMVRRMATRRPLAFVHTLISSEGSDSPQTTRDYFFTPDTPDEVVKNVHRRLQPGPILNGPEERAIRGSTALST